MISERIQVSPLLFSGIGEERAEHGGALRASAPLRWMKSGFFGNRYELQSANRCIATLSLRGFFQPAGYGAGFDGCWDIGPLNGGTGKIVVRSDDTLQEVGVFDMGLSSGGGILRTPDGQALVLQSDCWKGYAEFQTPSGEPLVRFRYRGFLRRSADVEILGEGKGLRELPWIVMLGWCLIVGYL